MKKKIQIDGMDKALHNKLWNALLETFWATMEGKRYIRQSKKMEILFKRIWHNYLERPLDTMWLEFSKAKTELRKIYFELEWNKVYDLIEFVVEYYPDEEFPITDHNNEFKKFCNIILEEENSGFRFVGDLITPIISEIEIKEIEKGLQSPLKPVQEHIETALKYLSDRKNPDYRNSIKEAISAVEHVCKKIAGKETTTLTVALNIIEKKGKIKLHPDLKDALQKQYWYTCDAEGIRHALMDEKNLSFEDAKFMLVSCSAFTNYLIQKADKAGIKLS